MNRAMLLVLVALALIFSGCCGLSQAVKDEVHTKQVIMSTFVQKMEAGETTREVEQEMLKAVRESFLVLDVGINDDKDAKALLDKLRE